MGARWPWKAKCANGHEYSGFSGGADPCGECGAEPVWECAGDSAWDEPEEGDECAGMTVQERAHAVVSEWWALTDPDVFLPETEQDGEDLDAALEDLTRRVVRAMAAAVEEAVLGQHAHVGQAPRLVGDPIGRDNRPVGGTVD